MPAYVLMYTIASLPFACPVVASRRVGSRPNPSYILQQKSRHGILIEELYPWVRAALGESHHIRGATHNIWTTPIELRGGAWQEGLSKSLGSSGAHWLARFSAMMTVIDREAFQARRDVVRDGGPVHMDQAAIGNRRSR